MDIATLKETGQDFEWYPTTQRIINTVKTSINALFRDDGFSILDIGAGDGRVLMEFKDKDLFAIEKSEPLIAGLDKDISILGVDFMQTTLIDKKIDIIFCNPPYSEYAAWMEKIIREGNCKIAYLVVPRRWSENIEIKEAIEAREATAEILDTFDFLDGERRARAIVDVVRIKLYTGDYYDKRVKTDPFAVWFDKHFPMEKEQDEKTSWEFKEKVTKTLVSRKNIVKVLVELYNDELSHLLNNYKTLTSLDAGILGEMGVSKNALIGSLKEKIEGLKTLYWNELLSRMDRITSRLITSTRKRMIDRFSGNRSVDFNESNAYAVVIWCVKNANAYYESQVISVVSNIISKANIKNYKSNFRTYQRDDWYYTRNSKEFEKYYLDLRIVVEGYSAITTETWDSTNGLHNISVEKIDDIVTIANTFGMFCQHRCYHFEWESGKKNTFMMMDGKPLMEVKAFKNGNLHIKFNQSFIRRLNVEFGRLKGWIKTPEQANDEMGISDAEKHFNTIRKISKNFLLE